MTTKNITIRGARTHNLQNINFAKRKVTLFRIYKVDKISICTNIRQATYITFCLTFVFMNSTAGEYSRFDIKQIYIHSR